MLRARKAEDKAVRRNAILTAAAELFERSDFSEVKMGDVARAAGIAKGTVFLYFPSKEILFLELLQRFFEGWMDDFERDLQRVSNSTEVAEVFCRGLSRHETLVRLMLLSSSLEAGLPLQRLVDFHVSLLNRIRRVGKCLEGQLSDSVRAGQGPKLVLRMYAVFIGFRKVANPKQKCRSVEDRVLDELDFDLDRECELCLAALLRGFAAAPA